MEVILLQDVEKVGLRGEVVNVSRGYMRNFLEPRRLAQAATPALVAELEKREAQRARHEARSVEQAEEIAETLRKTVLRFEVKAGERGTLFGSVTPTNIVDELWRARKVRVDRRKIHLRDPIKRVGRHEVPIDLFEGVRVDVKTLVVPEGGELPSDEELAAWEAEEAAEAAALQAELAPPAADEEELPAGDEEELTAAEAADEGAGDEALEAEPGELDTAAEEERSEAGDDVAAEDRSPAP